jgi:hypothetical protein
MVLFAEGKAADHMVNLSDPSNSLPTCFMNGRFLAESSAISRQDHDPLSSV